MFDLVGLKRERMDGVCEAVYGKGGVVKAKDVCG